jgi:glycogen operon protein
VEGPADDLEIVTLRERQKRNVLTTLFLSQGVPMLLHGDELGRTQEGNNNVYCQDNPISWVDWADARDNWALTDFVRSLSQLRRDHPVFRRRRFFQGDPSRGSESELGDIAWFTPAGEHMSEGDWQVGYARSVAVFLNGDAIVEPDWRGERVTDDSFLLFFNGHHDDMDFTVPREVYGERWEIVLDTAAPVVLDRPTAKAGEALTIESRSIMVLRRVV